MISAIVLAKNESEKIETCIRSLAWCTEVILADDASSDQTVAIAKSLGTRVVRLPALSSFSDKRNFALRYTKYPWVIYLDADEIVTSALAQKILTTISTSDVDGLTLKRDDYVWGKKLRFGETGALKFLRVGKKDKGEWEHEVHENWRIKGNITHINDEAIEHRPHQDTSSFLSMINDYTQRAAEERMPYLRKKTYGKLIILVQLLLYPSAKFINNYIFRLGFLDGTRGLFHAYLMALYSFVLRVKLWEGLNAVPQSNS